MSQRIKTRVRVNIAKTQKEGYGFETTVEADWDGEGVGEEQDEDQLYRLGQLLKQVRFVAMKECDERNAAEGRSSPWSTPAYDASYVVDGDAH